MGQQGAEQGSGGAWLASVLAAAIAGAAAALAVTFVVRDGDPSAAGVPPSAGVDPAALRALHEQLVDERIARERLEADVALLRSALELQARSERRRASEALARASAAHGEAGAAADEAEPRLPSPVEEPQSSSAFDADGLVALGVAESEAEWMRRQWESKELDKLYLADRAAREGWLFTPRYGEETAKIEGEVRREAGEERYDQMLYAAGMPNRVVVGGVLGGSVANEVGLLKGDQILRYGDQRIFRPLELRDATRSGQSGETVALEVLRHGRRETLYVPRGPLGASIQHERREPLP